MRMNTNIPMGFQPTNVLAMMDAGTQAGARMGEVQQRGRLLNAYREHGAGVLSGDPNAMNALAAIDLPQAMDFRGQNQAYRINEETMALRRQSARQQAAQAAAQMSREEAAAAAAGIGRALAPAITALRSGDLATVQQIAAAAGIPEEAIPQTLEEAEYLIASYEEALPVFESAQAVAGRVNAPAQPDYVTINGQLVDRNAQGGPSVVDVQGMPEQEAGFRVATPEEAAQYGASAGQIGPDGRFYPINPPPGMSIESDGQGGFRLTQGPGVTDGAFPDLTQDQGRNYGYALRAQESNEILSRFENEGRNLGSRLSEALPFGAGNYLVSDEYQQFSQAQRDFINAVLRRESGAVISPEEFANAEVQYFPMPGDGDDVIAQKARNRLNAIQGMVVSSGPAAPLLGNETSAPPPDSPPAVSEEADTIRPPFFPEAAWNQIEPDQRVRAAALWEAMTPEQRREALQP
jgi:hypothetical protein